MQKQSLSFLSKSFHVTREREIIIQLRSQRSDKKEKTVLTSFVTVYKSYTDVMI